ncbi:hypothetical protein CBR_g34392 [Chara braunii]|uniref:BED-type domain-containing protein n=1 Tax=Chara braunii TaxID=69332 RepID=A0A388LIN3_CHABU|nr:hypothetical protein CBR_g34392 [Chara braunii]|eukprot:GBG82111.1 hypothetical protein CBR_g34392 [Chara braunii]
MGRSQRRQHEAAADHVQDTFRARSPVYRYLVVGQKVDNKGVMMLRCTFCNKVFQGTQFQATRHFLQTNYCKDVSDEALYDIARRTQQKFEADQMERVSRYAAELGLDVPGTGGARGGKAGRRPAEGGVGGDGGHGAADPTLGAGGGETEEGVIHVDCEAHGPGDKGVPEREDVPEVYPGTGERLEDWRRREGKGAATEGSSKRKEGGSDPAATPAGKRLRQQKVTDVYGGEWVARHKKAFLHWLYSSGVSFNAFHNQAWKAYQQVLLEQPGSSPHAVLPNHCEIASMWAVETHRAELAEELEEEEGGPLAAAVESSMAPAAVSDAMIAAAVEEIAAAAAASELEEMAASVLAEDPPAAGGGAAVEGQEAAAGGAGGGAAAVEVEVATTLEEEDAPFGVGDPLRLGFVGGPSTQLRRGDIDGSGSIEGRGARQDLTQTTRERTTTQSPDAAHDIMEWERARLLASTGPRAQAFARAVEDARRLEIGGDCVQGGVVAGEDVVEGVAAESVPEAMPDGAETADVAVEGRTLAVDEAVQAGQRRVEGAINSRCEGQETATGPVVPFSGLHLAQARQPQAVQMAVHGVPPPVITDLGSELGVVPPRLPSHFAPQEVRRPLDAEELAREAVRDVTRLDRRIFDRKLEHPPWQSIPSVPWGPASPVWSGSTSTGGHTAGHGPGVSGGVTETAPRTGDMPPPPSKAPAGDPSSSPTSRGSRSPHTPGRSRIRDTTAVQQDVCDMTIFGRTNIHLDSTRRVTEHTACLQPGLGGGGTRTTTAREVPTSGCEPQRSRGRGVSTDTLEYALRAATRAVQEQTPRKRGVPPRPRPVPAEGGATLGESSGAEGLGMPRGSCREKTIAEASARVVVLRKGGGPITIE